MNTFTIIDSFKLEKNIDSVIVYSRFGEKKLFQTESIKNIPSNLTKKETRKLRTMLRYVRLKIERLDTFKKLCEKFPNENPDLLEVAMMKQDISCGIMNFIDECNGDEWDDQKLYYFDYLIKI